ncbi:MAG: hypothetical protein Q8J74_14955 [Candidatus Didemnitutus sp.]|nr:hypothetical protein [Candidatus Didemnitutus sp.]
MNMLSSSMAVGPGFWTLTSAAKRLRCRVFRGLFLLLIALALTAQTRATTVSPPEFPDLVNQSDYIVRAVVKSVSSEYERPGSRKIVTWVELQVSEVIAGTPPQPLVLRVMGGKVGDREMILEGAPEFKVGDENILFVQGNGQQIYPLVGMMHGVYPIKREEASGREFVTRSNWVPLQDIAEVALPMTSGGVAELQSKKISSAQALTPAEFAQRIRAVVKPSKPSPRDP